MPLSDVDLITATHFVFGSVLLEQSHAFNRVVTKNRSTMDGCGSQIFHSRAVTLNIVTSIYHRDQAAVCFVLWNISSSYGERGRCLTRLLRLDNDQVYPLLSCRRCLRYILVTHPLRILVELVPDLEEIRMPRQIPKVNPHRLTVNGYRLHPVVDADCRYVLGHKLWSKMREDGGGGGVFRHGWLLLKSTCCVLPPYVRTE